MSKVFLKVEGFSYLESYCYDDCCKSYHGWTLFPKKMSVVKEVCDQCDDERISIDYKHRDVSKEYALDAQMIVLIEKSLGHDLTDGEWISVRLTIDAIDIDSILLEPDIKPIRKKSNRRKS